MRTLLTTAGRLDATDPASITKCVADAHTEGLWLDIERPDADDFKLLEETFKFHPLTIEDIQHQNQRPKIDEYPDYNFAVIFQADWLGDDVAFREHHLYVGPHWLISVHIEPSSVLDALKDRIAKTPELTKGQPAFLTYFVIDALVDATFPALEQVDETVERLEGDILTKASPATLQRIYHLKHSVSELRRFLGAQRDVFQRLTTQGIHLQQADMTLYYRNVYDHIVRQYETVDSLRDLLTSTMDVHMSTVSHRLNETTKALTVIASLFLPLSFLTGFYGMNFSYLVNVLETPYLAFAVGVGTMLIATGIQLYFFHRRGWI
jgi:magnesium transporter